MVRSWSRLALFGLVVTACKDPILEPGPSGVPKLVLAQTQLVFTEVKVGSTRTATLRVTNDGAGVLSLSAIHVEGSALFTVAPPADLSISPKTSLDLPVTFDATTTARGRAVLQFASNDADHASIEVELLATPKTAARPSCDLVAYEHTMLFGEVDHVEDLFVENQGDVACTISAIDLPADTTFVARLRDHAPPYVLEPEQRATISLEWQNREVTRNEIMKISSDDPLEPELDIQLFGRSALDTLPCLSIYQLSFFQYTPVGGASATTIEVANIHPRYTCEVSLAFDDLGSGQFTYAISGSLEQLPPGATARITIFFRPETAGDYFATGTLTTTRGENQFFSVSAQAFLPSMCIEPRDLHMETDTATITVSACGDTALNVNRIEFYQPDPRISTEGTEALPWQLGPGQSKSFRVRTTAGARESATWQVYVDAGVFLADPYVRITHGGEMVPLSAGRYLDFDDFRNDTSTRIPLQGENALVPIFPIDPADHRFHSSSSDGRFSTSIRGRSLIEMRIYDRRYNTDSTIADSVSGAVSFRPDITGDPAYPFAYSDGMAIKLASPFLDEPYATLVEEGNRVELPAWGPVGKIAWIRESAGFSFLVLSEDEPGLGVRSEIPIDRVAFESAPASFSPNGRWLALTQGSGIEIFDAEDLTQSTVLTMLGADAVDPAFSLDGAFLSFVRGVDIYIVAIDPATAMPTADPVVVFSGFGPRHPTFTR